MEEDIHGFAVTDRKSSPLPERPFVQQVEQVRLFAEQISAQLDQEMLCDKLWELCNDELMRMQQEVLQRHRPSVPSELVI